MIKLFFQVLLAFILATVLSINFCAINKMQLIEEGLELIKKFEGFSSKPYKCCAGFLTIGYGHKIRSNEKYERISEMEANQMLQKDLQSSMYSVMNNIDFMLNNYQFSALVSFTYNVG